jgi:hypothetical protein
MSINSDKVNDKIILATSLNEEVTYEDSAVRHLYEKMIEIEGPELEHEEEDDESEEEEIERRCFKCPCLRNIFRKYNKRTLLVIGLSFFNEGAEFMTLQACSFYFMVE